MMKRLNALSLVIMMVGVTACGGNSGASSASSAALANDTPSSSVSAVTFNADTAYSYVAKQVELGPRVNDTKAHIDCQQLIIAALRNFQADSIIEQRAIITDAKGRKLPINNIMARYNPSATDRILLLAHYDTRPWADEEASAEARAKAVPGANDGASGVGVLLEIGRLLGQKAPRIGVDLLMVDAEDAGTSDAGEESWCLGTQHWVKDMPYSATNMPRMAILLDMVGGRDAKFYPEYFSTMAARDVVTAVWNMAHRSGYGSRFPTNIAGAVTDDHIFINRAGIPCIDIIECNNDATGTFPPYWHTLADDMQNIDRATLKAVGQTITNLIYSL